MKKAKFSYSDLLIVIGAFIFGWNCFYGYYYTTLGDLKQSIIYSLIITFVLVILAFLVANRKRVDRNFKSNFIIEMILLLCFFAFGFFFALRPFSHKFVVSERKVEIQQHLNNSIDSLSNLFSSYEIYANTRINLYESELKSVVKAKNVNYPAYTAYGFVNGKSESKQIATKLFTLEAKLFPSNFDDMKKNESEWYNEAKNAIDIWREKSVVDISNKVGANGNESITLLQDLSKFRAPNEHCHDFSFDSPNVSIHHLFTKNGNIPITSLIYAFLTYLLLLSSYLISRRSTRLTSLKDLFFNKTKDNELLTKKQNNEL
jgi:TfoX/Sxy family transcriptional regulator of competence genes